MTDPALQVFDARQTQARLPMTELCRQIEFAAAQMAAGLIQSPARQVLALPAGGSMLSMPASASDIAIHKLVNVCPGNAARQQATIHGVVGVYDATTGVPRLLLDGPTVTARRTAAVSLLAMRTLQQAPPRHVALIGTGTQARAHAQALAEVYPGLRVDIYGRTPERAAACCHQLAHLPLVLTPCSGAIAGGVDVVIFLTSSHTPLYDEPGRCDRLLIGTGAFRPDMAELGPGSIASSLVFCDDVAGAKHEAGDLIQAGVDWSRVHSLAEALAGQFDMATPRLFKSVGSATWDLAAARCALATTQGDSAA